MKKLISLTLFLTVIICLQSCNKVPITGRKQLNLIPNNEILSMSFQQYGTFIQENQLSKNTNQAEMVKRVGKKIQAAVEQYFGEKGLSSKLNGYAWEFNLVESQEVNAWCMPGGKVVVYTGILPVAQNETGLAVVMGHEIAHAVAEHGSERMSQSMISEYGNVALSIALQNKPETTQALWQTAYGIGSQVGVMLPYSRLHENEADKLGMIFMAMAGYDPNEAVHFWTRMAQMSGGASVPELLSTHPSNDTRIRKIKEALPEALTYYKKLTGSTPPASGTKKIQVNRN